MTALDQSARLAGRNLRRMRRNPASIAGAVVTPLVFQLGFFIVLRRMLEAQGIDYAQYLPPAIVVQATLNAAIGSAFWLADDRSTGFLDRNRSLPISRVAPLAGRMLADLSRAVVSMVVVLATGAVLGFRFAGGPLAGVVFVALVLLWTAAAVGGFGLVALHARNPEAAANLLTVPFLPLLLLSTAFVPAERFPSLLEGAVGAQPVSVVIGALRTLSDGGSMLDASVLGAFAWAGALCLLFLGLSARASRARR